MTDKQIPAFPVQSIYVEDQETNSRGMTLRDYFAAKAMQSILKDQYEDSLYIDDADNDSEHICARSAYIMADAMLKARNG